MIDPHFPIDWRLAVSIVTLLIAGVAKAVTGMGVPVAAVPVLVALYGDLRMVLVVTILATVVSDIPMLWKYRSRYRDAMMFSGFVIAAIIGVIIGTRILVFVNPAILSGVLALVVIAFIVVTWLGRLPTLSRSMASRISPLIGLLCGTLQGAAGAAGPLTTSYLISIDLPRESFLFAIIFLFSITDFTQFFTLQALHLTTLPVFAASVGILVLVFIGMGLGFKIQSRINDVVFKRGVLLMLAVATVGLLYRASRG